MFGEFLQEGNEPTEFLDPGAIESSSREEAHRLGERNKLFLGHINGCW